MTASFPDLFREAFDAHHASIFRYLDRLSGDPDLAADLTQEAFVRLYRRGSLPENPDRWLVTVALNLFRNRHAQRTRRGELRAVRELDLRPSGPASPLAAAGGSETRERVRRALDGLPDRDRQLLLLRAEGYSYREMAGILDLNETSVGTFLARARRSFLAAFEEES